MIQQKLQTKDEKPQVKDEKPKTKDEKPQTKDEKPEEALQISKKPQKGQKPPKPKGKQYYLKSFMRIVYKKLTTLNVSERVAEISATLVLSVDIEGLSQEIVTQIKQKMWITVNQQKNILIGKRQDQENIDLAIKIEKQKNLINFTYRQTFPLTLHCDVFWAPFEELKLDLIIELKTIRTAKQDTIKFDLRKYRPQPENQKNPIQNIIPMFSIKDNQDVGIYGLGEGTLNVKFTRQKQPKEPKPEKEQAKPGKDKLKDTQLLLSKPAQNAQESLKKSQKPKKDQVNPWIKATYSFSLFRYPVVSLLTIFFPLWLLAIINLLIFFQEMSLSGTLAAVATLMVAYSAFLPTIREQIPTSRNITFAQIIICSLLCTSLLSAYQRLLNYTPGAEEIDFDWKNNNYFLFSMYIVLSGILATFCLAANQVYTQYKFKKPLSEVNRGPPFDKYQWCQPQPQKKSQKPKIRHMGLLFILMIMAVSIILDYFIISIKTQPKTLMHQTQHSDYPPLIKEHQTPKKEGTKKKKNSKNPKKSD